MFLPPFRPNNASVGKRWQQNDTEGVAITVMSRHFTSSLQNKLKDCDYNLVFALILPDVTFFSIDTLQNQNT